MIIGALMSALKMVFTKLSLTTELTSGYLETLQIEFIGI